jgi:hypothetical protein
MSKQNTKKTIRVACKGAATLPLDALVPCQGALKQLSGASYEKLKKSLVTHGFSFPFFVWQSENKNWILDGHQRDVVLHRLVEEGWNVPPLPVVWVDAANEREAKEKILLLSSQYGVMSAESLLDFVKVSDIDFPKLNEMIDLPGIDFQGLLAKTGAKPADTEEIKYQFQVITDCASEGEQLAVIQKLEKEGHKCRALIL